MQIKELAECMGFQVLHGIVDCLLTEVDSYDWITFLPMSDGTGAYNSFVFTGKQQNILGYK
jgi:DNA polymerase I